MHTLAACGRRYPFVSMGCIHTSVAVHVDVCLIVVPSSYLCVHTQYVMFVMGMR